MAIAFTPTPGNIILPNMRITIGGSAMGLTIGGVEIECTSEWLKATSDQYGSMVVNQFNTGDDVKVKFGLHEFSYANLNRALGVTSTLRSTGGTAVGLGGLYAGAKSVSQAVALIFHPLDEDDTSLVDDINVWKAILHCEAISFGGKGKSETQLNVNCDVIADTSKTQGKMLVDFGLAAAT